ncbi:hypothetical protein Sros01_72690 [Streptomyces roseochromogenus]|nr:hypothetical protein Sros01_72690 [Streptomyces roseochromogenus]
MTFTWDIPPWQRNEDCTYMATTLTHVGGGQIAVNSESVRGDTPDEALADLLMGPGGRGGLAQVPGLVGVVIRRGVDVMWMAQPPIQVSAGAAGDWEIRVDASGGVEVTAFSAEDTIGLLDRLKAAYGGR